MKEYLTSVPTGVTLFNFFGRGISTVSSETWSDASMALSSSSSRVRLGKEELGVADTLKLHNLNLELEDENWMKQSKYLKHFGHLTKERHSKHLTEQFNVIYSC